MRSSNPSDGLKTRYVYDGGACIAEYDDGGKLLRKYVYGPGVDQPICMIDVEDSNSVYYYHFDGLGSVVALSDSEGDTVQTYEYGIFGQVAASDPNHPNPFMFTGRRLDFETGLYYYRARYYNPYIGRFMQTDPRGYIENLNLYTYCGNNPIGRVDPSGLLWASSVIHVEGSAYDGKTVNSTVQEKANSCAAAVIMLMLYDILGESVVAHLGSDKGWLQEVDVRKKFEEVMGVKNPTGNEMSIWGAGGSGVSMENALKVLNDYIPGTDNDYVMKTKKEWEFDDLKEYAKEGPVFFAVNVSGRSSHAQMLRWVEENSTQDAWGQDDSMQTDDWYWVDDPLYNGPIRRDSAHMQSWIEGLAAYDGAILVPKKAAGEGG